MKKIPTQDVFSWLEKARYAVYQNPSLRFGQALCNLLSQSTEYYELMNSLCGSRADFYYQREPGTVVALLLEHYVENNNND